MRIVLFLKEFIETVIAAALLYAAVNNPHAWFYDMAQLDCFEPSLNLLV